MLTAVTLTKEQFEKTYRCRNNIKNGYFSWLKSPGNMSINSAGMCRNGGIREFGHSVDHQEGNHSPALLMPKECGPFQIFEKLLSPKEGDEIEIDLKYDLGRDWGMSPETVEAAKARDYNGEKIKLRVEMDEYVDEEGEKYLMIIPTMPIAVAYLYESGEYGVGECKADEICKVIEQEFCDSIQGMLQNMASNSKKDDKCGC